MADRALKPYHAYRDSGQPGLGAVPEHWDILRSRYIFREIDKRSEAGEETQLSMSQIHGLVESSKIDTWRLRSETYAGGKLCEPGDLVLNRLKAHLGVFAHASIPGVVSPDYTVFRPIRGGDVRYFEYLYKTPIYTAELRKRTKGIVEGFWRLYSDDFYDLRVVVPPEGEQRRIVVFIDSFDEVFRRLIRNKRRLIALLNEQKQGIINQAVTRGLDPKGSMKPTGIDWMPEVPSHWEVKRLKTLVRNVTEQVGSVQDDETYIALEHVKSWTGDVVPPGDEIVFDSQVKRFHEGDILFGKLRPYLAKVTRAKRRGVCVGEFLVLRPAANEILGEFLEQKLRSRNVIDLVSSSTYGAKMPRAEWGFIGNVRFAFPPDIAEQKNIIRLVSDRTRALNNAISRTEREIALVREYRERLISDVVTGKLDVRDAEIFMLEKDVVTDDVEDVEEGAEADDTEALEMVDAAD